MALSRKDLDKGDMKTFAKVACVARSSFSKRELSKVMAYCAGWNGTDSEHALACNHLYSEVCRRIESLGSTPGHVDEYLPKSWAG